MATINKPQDQGLNVQIGENKRLNKSTSEKAQEYGYALYGAGSGLKGLGDASTDFSLLKNLDAGADDVAKQYGISKNAAKVMLLTGKITPQGIATYTDKTTDTAGFQQIAPVLGTIFGQLLDRVNNQPKVDANGNLIPASPTNPLTPNPQAAENPIQATGQEEGSSVITDAGASPSPSVFGSPIPGPSPVATIAPKTTFKEGEDVTLAGNATATGTPTPFGTPVPRVNPNVTADVSGQIDALGPEGKKVFGKYFDKYIKGPATESMINKDSSDIGAKQRELPSKIDKNTAGARASNATADLNEQRGGTKKAGAYVQAEIGAKNRSGLAKAKKPEDILLEKVLSKRSLREAKVNPAYLTDQQIQTLNRIAQESGYDETQIRSAYKKFLGDKLQQADSEFSAARKR